MKKTRSRKTSDPSYRGMRLAIKEKDVAIQNLPALLDEIECRVDVALSDLAAIHSSLALIKSFLASARGDRPATVSYSPGVGELGLGDGFYTQEDFERAQGY